MSFPYIIWLIVVVHISGEKPSMYSDLASQITWTGHKIYVQPFKKATCDRIDKD